MNNAIITGTGKIGIDLYIKLKKLDKIIDSKKAEIIEDLSPLLPRKEFYKNMNISLIKRNKKIFEAN